MKTVLISLFIAYTFSQPMPLAIRLDQHTKFNDFKASCFLFNRTSWMYYDLNPISRPPNKTQDYTIITHNNTTIYYNFCGETIYQCDPLRKSLLNIKYADGSCWYFDNSPKANKFWNLNQLVLERNAFSSGKEEEYILLTVYSNQRCFRERNYTLSFHIKCDREMDEGEFSLNENSYTSFEKENYCDKTLRLTSKHGCGVKPIYSVWKFYMEYSYLFGNCLIIIGFYVLLRGITFKRVTSVLYGTHTGLIIFFYTMSAFDAIVNDTILWYCAITSLIIGSFLGYFINRWKKLRNILIAAWCGYVLATVSYYAFFAYFNLVLDIDAHLLYAIVILSGVVLITVLSLFIKENTVHLMAHPTCGSCAVLRVFLF
jgi:hypothetical protein